MLICALEILIIIIIIIIIIINIIIQYIPHVGLKPDSPQIMSTRWQYIDQHVHHTCTLITR